MPEDNDIKQHIHTMGAQAVEAARHLARLDTDTKNRILLAMADGIVAASDAIVTANQLDLEHGRAKGLSDALLDRLALDTGRIQSIANAIRKVATLPDPVGECLAQWSRPNGIQITKQRVPIGVIGIIYESRPNVTSDAAVLCFKSGNATILRGGSEAIHSNRAIAAALQESGATAGLPENAIQLIPFTDRESVRHMAEMDTCLDLIIPRGGHSLIETVVSLARMPVIKHYDGICHTYVHRAADLEMATRITVDAKTQKPSVCNALETLLVDREIAPTFLPKVAEALQEKGVEMRGDDATRKILGTGITSAEATDWDTEYLDLILAIRVVENLDGALEHIHVHSSQHSDCIVTSDAQAAQSFMAGVDSAAVFWNVSTRFSDGEEFGFGAEIGISTDKLHARGPMALPELTSYKYLVEGAGQTKG
jgi:glutamate-5-semialdehyde dehydrogenase